MSKKPIDLSKFRKDITKNLSNISLGFNDPTTWIDTGCYGLNYLISGDFNKGVPLGKVTMLAGQSGSGKSYIASGNLVKDAQRQGIFVVLIDTENALDEAWLHALGVSTDEDKLMKINASMVNDVAKIINDFMDGYKKEYGDEPKEDRPKILFVIDSVGMLLTPTDVDQFNKGDMKGDMGRKPKALKALISNTLNALGDNPIGLICTNHSYQSQDMFNPDDIISGGQGIVYAASIVVAMGKRKLKEDAEGNKVSDVLGIRSVAKCVKSRYSKPHEQIELLIPYETGMDPYSGLIDLFEKKELLIKEGNKLKHTFLDGTEDKWFRKQIIKDKTILDRIMKEFPEQMAKREKVNSILNSPSDEDIVE